LWSRAIALTFAIAALLACWPCVAPAKSFEESIRSFFPGASPPSPPRLVLVFVDISGSIPQGDWRIYGSTFESLVGSDDPHGRQPALTAASQGEPGDRLTLATISQATLTGFAPVADGTLTNTGHVFPDREANRATLHRLRTAFAGLKTARPSNKTRILDALNLSQQLIEQEVGRRYVIVLLSDMLEDSEAADFERRAPTPALTQAIINRRRAEHLIPDLHRAQLYVVGAKAADAARYQAVESFWTRYFHEANAVLPIGAYGRAPIDFAEAWRR